MALVEGDLVKQAGIQVREHAGVVKQQKEADQISRQLFADCVKTIELHGSRCAEPRGSGRWRTLKTDLMSNANSGSVSVGILLSTGRVPFQSNVVRVILDETNYGLVLNKSLGYSEIYPIYPKRDGSISPPRRANIYEVTSFREAVSSIKEFTRADTVPWPDDVIRYSRMDDSTLERALKRTKRWSNINCELGRLGMVGAFLGLVAGGLSGHPEGVFGGTGVIIGGGISSMVINARLDRKVMIIQDEVASRS